MEPLFINKCIYTKSNLIEVNRSAFPRKLPTIIFICTGLIIFSCGLLIGDYVYCLLGVLFCVFYPLYSLWAVRYSAVIKYQQLQQLYHSEAETVTSFYEDCLVVHQMRDGSDVNIAYSQIAKVFETKKIFFLMLSTRVGFMLEKQGFVGTTADEFGGFIRARAVGEGQKEYKKKKRKSALITGTVLLILFAIGLSIGFFGQVIEDNLPKTFTYGNYSIKLTSAFDDYDGEWNNPDATVYCFQETSEELSSNGYTYDTAAAYLKDTNESYGIDSAVTAVSDISAWASYTNTVDGNEYYNYDYVVEADGDFWHTEFYCLAEDAGKYTPLLKSGRKP